MNALRCYLALALLSGASAVGLLAAEPPSSLPVRRVVLFTSGVAFVEHAGEVEGNQAVALHFHVDDVNDLLKSLVVNDEGGGRIANISYTPQAPLEVRLGELRIDPSRVRSLGDLLQLLRGERIEIELTASTLSGQIVAIDKRKVQLAADQVVEQETLLLKSETGLRNVPLANVVAVKLVDAALDRDLQEALSMLATGHAADKKEVKLQFQGKGKRQVRVGYIQEFPVWKASYRLVLDEKQEPHLQGWAIVENTTDQDWQDVQVALVNGRPVSFTMDLYSPIFLERPSVVPQLFAGLQPKTHGQNLLPAAPVLPPPQVAGLGGGFAGGGRGFAGGLGGGGFGNAGPQGFADSDDVTVFDNGNREQPLNPRSSLQVAASTGDVGTFFRYQLEHPVTLDHQKSVLLPLVDAPLKAKKTSLYNEKTHEKHPLSALQITNSTKLQIMSGAATLFDDSEYAGDAELPNMAPGDQRLVSYALDLNLDVLAEAVAVEPEAVIGVRFNKGLAHIKRRQTRQKKYTIKNSHADERKLLVEHPRDNEWKLVKPAQATETSRDVYRFEVTIPPSQTVTLTVAEERVRGEQLTLDGTPPENYGSAARSEFHAFLIDDKFSATRLLAKSLPEPGSALQQALKTWESLLEPVQQTTRELARVNARQNALSNDLARTRENLAAVPTSTEQHRRYLKSLDDQVNELATLDKLAQEREAKLEEQRGALRKFLETLQAE